MRISDARAMTTRKMDDFLEKLKKVVRIVLYGPAISQSDCRKAGLYQLPFNKINKYIVYSFWSCIFPLWCISSPRAFVKRISEKLGLRKRKKPSFLLLFEQRWPKFHKFKSIHCVSIFISHTNFNTFLFVKIHHFILIVSTSSN